MSCESLSKFAPGAGFFSLLKQKRIPNSQGHWGTVDNNNLTAVTFKELENYEGIRTGISAQKKYELEREDCEEIS